MANKKEGRASRNKAKSQRQFAITFANRMKANKKHVESNPNDKKAEKWGEDQWKKR